VCTSEHGDISGGGIIGPGHFAATSGYPRLERVIHGRYANKGGGLRVIDTGTGQRCNANKETPLNWNQSGPTGAAGPSDAYTVEGSRVIQATERTTRSP
jgi:hypothetical protein